MKDSYKYISLWMLLAVALTVVMLVSFADDISLGNWTVKKAPVAETLLGDSAVISDEFLADIDSMAAVAAEKKEVVVTDSAPQSLFIFGDSMTFNLALRLAQYAKQNGHQINSVNWDSSNTKIWAESDTLKFYLEKFKPTQVFVSLGSNEIYFKNPETRAPYVKKIIEMIDTIPFVWIGPPNWKEDTGINDMLEKMCGSRRFFRSAGMDFKRKKDNIHPTKASSALWIDSIVRWLPKSQHPFVAETPADSIGKANPHIVFLKALNK